MGDRNQRVDIQVLGPLMLTVGGHPQALRGHQQKVVLARLALGGGRPIPVDSLIDDLWEDAVPSDPEHALQAHVSRLRPLIPGGIEYSDGGYRFSDPAPVIDAEQFYALRDHGRSELADGRATRAVEAFDEALSLWHGTALEGLGEIPGLRPFRLRLEEQRRAVRTSRVEALLACGRGGSAIADLRAALTDDPLHEDLWHQLMRALHQSGREAEALATYDLARREFIDRTGVEPGTTLVDLHTEILTGLPSRPAPAGDGPALVGRHRELSALELAWSECHDGLRVATLSGGPGIGKTRLADAFARQVAASGGRVLRGRGDPAIAEPYHPISQLLRDHVEPHRLAPELAPILPELTAGHVDQYRTMDAVAGWLADLTATGRALIVLDDLQWADEQTLLVVQSLMRSRRCIRGMLLLSIRDRETSIATPSTLAGVLRQSDAVTHLALPPLSEDETDELVRTERERFPTARSLPGWAAEYIGSSADGNPLFIVELTRQLLLGGDLSVGVPSPPAAVSRVIIDRVGLLPADAQTALRVAAVAGAELDVGLLRTVTELSVADIDAALQRAQHLRLVQPTAGPHLVFSHDIVRTVLYDSIPPTERARVHRRVAESLDTDPAAGGAGNQRRLAHHYRNSDRADAAAQAARHLLFNGRNALDRDAPADAEAIFIDGLDLIGVGTDDQLRCDLLIGLGTAQLQSASPKYRTTLGEASELANRLGDSERLTAAVLANTRGWWSNTFDVDHQHVADIETALARTPADDLRSHSQLLIAWSRENVRDPGRRDDVLASASSALDAAERSADPVALASVLADRYAVLHALFDDPVECVRISERLLDVATRLGDRRIRLSAAVGLAQATMRLGEFAAADHHLGEAEQLAEALNDPPRLWLVRGWLAMRCATRGRLERAEQLVSAAFELGAQTEQDDAFTWFAGQLFTLRMLQGRLPEIVDAVTEQVDAAADGIPAWRAAQALALARSRRHDAATDIVERFAADSFARLPVDMLRLHGLHYFAMTCEELGRADIGAQLYRLLAPHTGLLATNGTIDAGPVDLHLGVLARLAGRHAIADRHLQAAAALCGRIDAPVWRDAANARLSAA